MIYSMSESSAICVSKLRDCPVPAQACLLDSRLLTSLTGPLPCPVPLFPSPSPPHGSGCADSACAGGGALVPGTYASVGASSCLGTLCAPGTYGPAGATSATTATCVDCPAGGTPCPSTLVGCACAFGSILAHTHTHTIYINTHKFICIHTCLAIACA